MTDMRAQFEAWAQRGNLSVERNPAYGNYGERAYVSFSTDIFWRAVEASSAELGAEVERLRGALQEIAEMTEHVQYGPENLINSVATCALSRKERSHDRPHR